MSPLSTQKRILCCARCSRHPTGPLGSNWLLFFYNWIEIDLTIFLFLPNTASLCDCIKTIYKEANKALEVEDEELEYVYLMKYFDLIQTVRQAKDYKSEEKKVRSGLGSNDQLFDRMDRLEAIQNSLKKRYEQRSENAKRSTAKNSQNSIVTSTAIGDTSNTIETNDVTQHEKAKVHSASIDCTELYRLMEDRSVSMLVMDCRHSDEFDESHLRYKNLINIPGQLIKRGYNQTEANISFASHQFRLDIWVILIFSKLTDYRRALCNRRWIQVWKRRGHHEASWIAWYLSTGIPNRHRTLTHQLAPYAKFCYT